MISSVNRINLHFILLAIFLLLWGGQGCDDSPPVKSLGPQWMRQAKLAGLSAYMGMSDKQLLIRMQKSD